MKVLYEDEYETVTEWTYGGVPWARHSEPGEPKVSCRYIYREDGVLWGVMERYADWEAYCYPGGVGSVSIATGTWRECITAAAADVQKFWREQDGAA